MANRQPEKKEDNRIPVVTPDRRQNAEEQQIRREYKANIKWRNPHSFLGQSEQPNQESTPKEAQITTATDVGRRRRRRSNMTDTKKTMSTAKELKDEMNWSYKPKKTPTILEVLEFKAEMTKGLMKCNYRGGKQGHTFLIETKEELRDRIKDPNAMQTTRPKPPQEPMEPAHINNDKLWERFKR